VPLPKTEIPGRLQSLLTERGIRMTRQRRAILHVIETAKKHLDANQLLRRAQKTDATIDRSTLYRTIDLLKRHGLIDELDLMHLRGEAHYYERKTGRDHVHMTCLGCGGVTEVVNERFDALKAQLEQDAGFQIRVARLEIGGYCSKCRTR
jgi:Fur family ferric uptake transcriptional regulator